MERRNRDALRQFPGTDGKIQFLGMFDHRSQEIEIADPYSARAGATVAVCRRIASAVVGLVAHTRRSSAAATLGPARAPEAAR